ncbi:MAG: hypothetical protein RL588_969 [Pseudomonadota bacterium]
MSVAGVAISAGFSILCFVDQLKAQDELLGIPVRPRIPEAPAPEPVNLALAIGDNSSRKSAHDALGGPQAKYAFPVIAHPTAVTSPFSEVGTGTVLMPGAVIGPNSKVGAFCILNTGASLDHDSTMGDFASLAPGAMTGGGVKIGLRTAIGIGAAIRHGLVIGDDTVLGAKSYLNRDLPGGVVAYGAPARIIRTRTPDTPYLT